jgi:ATP-dependent Clp protease ATP-binding subunit ClpA
MRKIDVARCSQKVTDVRKKFESWIVGQSEATEAVVHILEKYFGGLNDPKRPIGSLLFLGPTGTGKTSLVEALCEGLYGSSNMMIKIDCSEFQYGHEIAKLIGSPPGYLGHKETPARFTQATMLANQTKEFPFTIVLFDEIEKASDDLWQLLLNVLDKGTLTLGDNSRTCFTNSIIFMTSNLGTQKLNFGDKPTLGFQPMELETLSYDDLKRITKSAAVEKFTSEFLNRLDEIVTFHSLTSPQIEEVLKMELRKIKNTLLLKNGSFLEVSPAAMKELMVRGYDAKYNARNIRRTLEKEVVVPVSRALSCGEIGDGENVVVDYAGAFEFFSHRMFKTAETGL